jgi:hypothetical protein
MEARRGEVAEMGAAVLRPYKIEYGEGVEARRGDRREIPRANVALGMTG